MSDALGDSSGVARQLLYIPTGPTDPLVNFDVGFDQTAFFDYLQKAGLNRYAGGSVPKGTLDQSSSSDLDIRIQQELPFFGGATALLFLDIENVLNLLSDSSGSKRYINTTNIDEGVSVVNGGITGGQYDFVEFTQPTTFPDTFDSLYRIQLGIRIDF